MFWWWFHSSFQQICYLRGICWPSTKLRNELRIQRMYSMDPLVPVGPTVVQHPPGNLCCKIVIMIVIPHIFFSFTLSCSFSQVHPRNSTGDLIQLVFSDPLWYEHISPILRSLHWVPVSARIDFERLLLVFKVLNGLGPLYLSELLKLYIPSRTLRSSND